MGDAEAAKGLRQILQPDVDVVNIDPMALKLTGIER